MPLGDSPVVNLQVKQQLIDKLKPYPKNARTHDQAQIATIAASIRAYGFNNPVLIDGEFGIVAGHGRVEAAKQLGLKKLPCIQLSHLTPEQRQAYIIADNKIAERGGWDKDILSVELTELQSLGTDLSTLGLEPAELDGLFAAGGDDPTKLPKGDRRPSQQMSFTVHDSQADEVKRALDLATESGPFTGPNKSANGNALHRICQTYLAAKADRPSNVTG